MSEDNQFKSGFDFGGPATTPPRAARVATAPIIPPQTEEIDPDVEAAIRKKLLSPQKQDQEFLMNLGNMDEADDVIPQEEEEPQPELPRNTLMEETHAESVSSSNFQTGMWMRVVERFGKVELTDEEQADMIRAAYHEQPLELDVSISANARGETGNKFTIRCRAIDPWEEELIDRATRLDINENVALGLSIMDTGSLAVSLMQQYTVYMHAMSISGVPLKWVRPTEDMPVEEALECMRTNMKATMRKIPAVRWTVLMGCTGIFLVKFHIFKEALLRGDF